MSHRPYDELASAIRYESHRLEPGAIHQTYGRRCQIERLAIDEALDEVGVIYHDVNYSEVPFFSPIAGWLAANNAVFEPHDFMEYERKLRLSVHEAEPGTTWRHCKGTEYVVKSLVILSRSQDVGVIYHDINHSEVPFCRALANFLGSVGIGKDSVPRFVQKASYI